MLYSLLSAGTEPAQIAWLAAVVSFVMVFLLLGRRFSFLPRDHGRDYAVHGEQSKGKLRGVGVIMIPAASLIMLVFCRVSLEAVIYVLLLNVMMISGYLDDASETPWKDYKKGLIDFVVSAASMLVFLYANGTECRFFSLTFHIPGPLYFILGVILLWAAINVTNCSDGIDGLCGTLSVITILSFTAIFRDSLREYGSYAAVLTGAILAYLYYNCRPSTMLMGDAGSRAIGFFIGLLALKSGHPFSYLLLSIVLIVDGGLGLIKVSVRRFLHVKNFMSNFRTPVHDHLRMPVDAVPSGKGWSDSQVIVRLALFQIVASMILGILI